MIFRVLVSDRPRRLDGDRSRATVSKIKIYYYSIVKGFILEKSVRSGDQDKCLNDYSSLSLNESGHLPKILILFIIFV